VGECPVDIIEAMQSRKSIRGYKPTPVPQEVLRNILDAATRAPSADNAQPWEIAVVAGEALDRIGEGNMAMFKSGAPRYPETIVQPYGGVYRRRQVEVAGDIFRLMGIPREDGEKRMEWMQRGLRFFDAPAGFIIYTEKSLEVPYPLIDIGGLVQSICLAALHYDLGTCAHDQGIMFPEVVRKVLGIPQSKRFIMCVAIGYPDWDFPANKLRSRRESIDNITTWYGFD